MLLLFCPRHWQVLALARAVHQNLHMHLHTQKGVVDIDEQDAFGQDGVSLVRPLSAC